MHNLRKLFVLGIILMLAAGTASAVDITFRVDMNVQIQLGAFDAEADSVGLNGTMNSWGNPSTRLHDPDEDGIYEAVVELTAGETEYFKFIVAPDGDYGAPQWEGVDDRELVVPNDDTVLDVIYFNDDPGGGVYEAYEILFQVDMQYAIQAGTFDPVTDGLVLRGDMTELGWDTYDNALIEIGATNVYAILVNFAALELGADYGYKFVIDPDNDQAGEVVWEELPQGGNRIFTPTGEEPDDDNDGDHDVAMDVVFWGDQDQVTTVAIDVTFKVDGAPALRRVDSGDTDWLPAGTTDVDYIIVTGTFDNWGWSQENYKLYDDGVAPDETLGDSLFTGIVTFPIASPLEHQYKYGANGSDNEAGFAENRLLVLDDPNPTQLVEDLFGEQGTLFDPWMSVREIPTATLPTDFVVEQNYPNPFNPTTTIAFNLPKPGDVTFRIFNVTGQEVIAENLDNLNAGRYELNVDASNFASGVYFYRVEANGLSQTKKMVLAK